MKDKPTSVLHNDPNLYNTFLIIDIPDCLLVLLSACTTNNLAKTNGYQWWNCTKNVHFLFLIFFSESQHEKVYKKSKKMKCNLQITWRGNP